MAEAPKTGWWQTLPGLLTAAAAFIAALTGLIAGLNQLGVFERDEEPVEQAVGPSGPLPPDTATRPAPVPGPAATDSAPAPSPAAPRPVPRTRTTPKAPDPAAPAPERAPADTTPPADTSARPPPAAVPDTALPDTVIPDVARPKPATPDTAAAADTAPPADTGPIVRPAPEVVEAVLPRGTVLELAAGSRVCSTTSSAGDRFRATLVVPVAVESGVALPVGTTAVLEIQRLPAPNFIGARLDSLVREGEAVAVRAADLRVRGREFVAGAGEEGVGVGACIPAGARITAKLTESLRLGGD